MMMKLTLVTYLVVLVMVCFAQSAEEYYLIGEGHSLSGRYKEAIDSYTEALKLEPGHKHSLYNRGVTKERMGNYIEAIADFNQLLSLDSTYGLAYSARANSKFNLGDYRGAIRDYTLAIKHSYPNYKDRAMAYFLLKNYIKAREDFSRLVESGSSLYYLGLCEIELKNKEKGCQLLSRAGELGYKDAYPKIREVCQ